MSLGRAVATIGGWTMLSRITGLVREMLIARFLGAGLVADAFFVAFRLPNLFRSLFAEGAFNPAFVPLFTSSLEGDGHAAAKRFAEDCLSVLTAILLLFVCVAELSMPWFMYVLAPGFDDLPGKLELATTLSRITFPYLLLISLVSLQSGVLNALGRFAAAAGTPVLLNLTAIAVLVGLAPYTPTPGHAMAWGVFASGLAQFAWLVFSVRKAGMPLRWHWPRLTPQVKEMLRRVIPGAVGAGVYQVNLTINTMIASNLVNGAVSYLNFAERVNQLPLGVVGVAIGTALLPLLSRHIRAGDETEAFRAHSRALEMGMLVTLPACAALMVIPEPIVLTLFQRGAFTVEDAHAVAHCLRLLALGLPAYMLVKVLTPAFFARHDTRTPVRIAMMSMGVNVVMNLALMKPLGYAGMALSTALAAWLNVIGLVVVLGRRGELRLTRGSARRIPRQLLAVGLMSALLAGGQMVTVPLMGHLAGRIAGLGLLVGLGVCGYIVAIYVTGAASAEQFNALLKRKRGGTKNRA